MALPNSQRLRWRRGLARVSVLALIGVVLVAALVAWRAGPRARSGAQPPTRACRAPMVSIRNGPYVGGATQEEAHSLAVTNTSSLPCSLHGYVELVVYDTHRRPLAFRFAHHPTGGWPMATAVPPPFTIRPRASGYVFFAQVACYSGYSATSRRIGVRLPGDRQTRPVTLRTPVAWCAGPSAGVGNILAISPVEPSISATEAPVP